MNNELFDMWSAMRKTTFQRTLDDLDELVSSIQGDPDKVVKICLEKVSQIMRCEASSFWILKENGDGMIAPVAYIGSADLSKIRLFPGEGIVGKVINSSEPLIIEDCINSESFASNVDKKTGFITKSMVCTPCAVKGITFGCIQMINRIDDSLFDNEDLNMVINLSEKVSDILAKYDVLKSYGYDFDKAVKTVGGQNRTIVSMLVDVYGFEKMATKIDSSVLAYIMNKTTQYISSVIKQNNGHVNNLCFDDVISYWVEDENNNASYSACKAALEILKNQPKFLSEIKDKYGVDVEIKISVYEGDAYVGYFGEDSLLNDMPIGTSIKLTLDMLKVSKKEELLVSKKVLDNLEKDYQAFATYHSRLAISEDEYEDIYRIVDIR